MEIRVAYQGVEGSFSSLAARTLFGDTLTPINTRRFREIFEHVVAGRADVGVVPLENALAGSVHENLDLLAEFNCFIVAEYYCPVQLHLMALPGAGDNLSSFTQVLSHPKALEQSSKFLEQHHHLAPVVHSDTAGAALHVRTLGDRRLAAIASEEAAEAYGLSIIARSVQNHPSNATRFIALKAAADPVSEPSKASLLLTLPHEPGSLYRLLGEVARYEVNLTKIESRPISGKPFHYAFHIDLEADPNEWSKLLECIEALKGTSTECKVLGLYKSSHARARQ